MHLVILLLQWEKNQIPPLRIRSGFRHELSYIRLLVMILLQVLVGDLHEGHLGSDDVIRGHQQFFFTNNSRLKIATNMGLVSLCLFCQDASTDTQHDLLGSTRDLT